MSLDVHDLHFFIRKTHILRGIRCTAEPGHLTAIVGHNGSGKTTLMRCVTGEETGEGTISLNATPLGNLSAAHLASLRGVLPQAANVAVPFKVIEVVRLGHRAGTHAADPEVPHLALEAVGLQGFEGRFYQELSGGEQQRVQLARVLSQVWSPLLDGAPRWLFVDEPVASLDISHQLRIMDLARDYAARGGGVIAVMHDLNLTAMYADRVAVMKAGEIMAFGTPHDVLTEAVLSDAYSCALRVNTRPEGRTPFILPQAAGPRDGQG